MSFRAGIIIVKIAIACAAIFSILCLSGCGHLLDSLDLRDETVLPPAYPNDEPPPRKTRGTIYQAGHEITLYQDHIARRVGDILTVRLEESTTGEKQAKMKTSKTDQIDTNIAAASSKPRMFNTPINPLIFNLGDNSQFEGKGETNEFNKLRGTVSVTVLRVLSNGNLVVQGESWVTINQGREFIRLEGIARSEDIEPNNMISSQRLTNSRITYSGSGQVGNSARGGIITQLMTKFFPY